MGNAEMGEREAYRESDNLRLRVPSKCRERNKNRVLFVVPHPSPFISTRHSPFDFVLPPHCSQSSARSVTVLGKKKDTDTGTGSHDDLVQHPAYDAEVPQSR